MNRSLVANARAGAPGMIAGTPLPQMPVAHRLHFGTWELHFTGLGGTNASKLWWSDEVYRIAGLEPRSTEVSSELFYKLVHPEDRELVRAAVADAAGNRIDYSIAHRLVRPNGEIRIVHETARLIFDPQTGELERMIGTMHDLTEQREMEQRFRQLAENIQEVFWLTTADKKQLLYISPNYELIFGRSRTELYRNPTAWLESVHPNDRERVAAALKQQRAGEFSEEYRIILPDESERWISDRAFAITDGAGEVYRIAGVALDVTARKETELALARSNRSLTLLTACHEALIRATDEERLIHEICELAVTMGGYRMAWVGYAEDDASKSILPKAWAGEESGYLSEIRLSWSDCEPTGHGPAAESIRSGRAAVCEDLRDHGFFWKKAASDRGYRHVVCLPLKDESRAFGLLALYSAESMRIPEAELKLLQELADDLAFGIANVRSRLGRQRAESMVTKIAQAVSTKAGSEFFASLTQSMVDALRAKGGAIGKLQPADRSKIDTLSFYVDGAFLENVSYSIVGTPCAKVVSGEASIFERDLQMIFPEDAMLPEMGLHAYAGIPLFTPQGEVTGLMAVFFDRPIKDGDLVLSTLKIFAARAGAEIQRQEAGARIREQASLLDKARDAILTRDLQHRITYWNKSAERMYGWTASEVLGQPINKLLYRDEGPFHAAMAALMEAGEWTGELTQVDKRGETLTVECRWTLVHDDKGQPQSVLAINTDVTERKKLEAQFLRAQRMESIGTLAGGIAHDLNNVLAPILMSIELLRGQLEPAVRTRILDTLESSATRGADLVRQVLLFARGAQGKRVVVDPAQVVGEVEAMIRETFPKNIRATIEKPATPWAVHGDPTQLNQVLVNLAVNARDAMPAGGDLHIAVQNSAVSSAQAARFGQEAKPGNYSRIIVRDTGSGIHGEMLDKIFEPFFTTKEVGSGTGLGLSTTLAIVRSHGGFIHVESAPGQGSAFHVYLPSCAEANTASGARQQPTVPRGNGELILIIDDEDAMRALARNVLERFGYRVNVARNGQEALDYFQAHHAEVSLVVTDMAMPVMDGPTVIRALREIRPDIRIIGSSGLSTQAAVAAATGQTIRFLPKPYNTAALLKEIRDALA